MVASFIFLVTVECIYDVPLFLAHTNYVKQQVLWYDVVLMEAWYARRRQCINKWTLQQYGMPSCTVWKTSITSHTCGLRTLPSLSWTCSLQQTGYKACGLQNLGVLQEQVYHGRKFDTVDQLQHLIMLEWRAVPWHFIDHSIGEWRRRLKCVVV